MVMQVNQPLERPYAASGMNSMPRQRRQCRLVSGSHRPPPRHLRVEPGQLAAANRREQVAQAVVVANVFVLVVRRRLPGLRRQVARPIDDVAAVRDEHAAAAGRDDLVAVERERRAVAERTRLPATAQVAPSAFGGVFDQRHAVALADRFDAARSRRTGRRGPPRPPRPAAGRSRARRASSSSSRSGSMFQVSRETSTNTGVAPT